LEGEETMKEMTIIPKSILEEGAIAWEKTGFRRGWNSALEEIRPKRCMCFVHKDIEGYKCEFCNLIEELKVKK